MTTPDWLGLPIDDPTTYYNPAHVVAVEYAMPATLVVHFTNGKHGTHTYPDAESCIADLKRFRGPDA